MLMDEINLPRAIMQMIGREMGITLSMDIIEDISKSILTKLKEYDSTINFTGIKAVDDIDDLTSDDYYTHKVYGNSEMYEVVDKSVVNVKTDTIVAVFPVVFSDEGVRVFKLTEIDGFPKRRIFVKSQFSAETEIDDFYPTNIEGNEQLKFLNALTGERLENNGTACIFKLMIRTESIIKKRKFIIDIGKRCTVVDRQSYVGAVLIQSQSMNNDNNSIDNDENLSGGVKVFDATNGPEEIMNDKTIPDFVKKDIIKKLGETPVKKSPPKPVSLSPSVKKKNMIRDIMKRYSSVLDKSKVQKTLYDNSVKEINSLITNANIISNLSEFSVMFSNDPESARCIKDFNFEVSTRFSSLLEVYKNDKRISITPKKVNDVLETDNHLIGFLKSEGDHKAVAVILDSTTTENNELEYQILWCVVSPTFNQEWVYDKTLDTTNG